MSFYTEKAFEVSIARKLLVDNNNKEIDSKSFHPGYYILTVIKRGLSVFNFNPKWETTQNFIDSSEEACMQIDIAYMARKLSYLDAAISKLLEKHEI